MVRFAVLLVVVCLAPLALAAGGTDAATARKTAVRPS
jgi:hypothetical protein